MWLFINGITGLCVLEIGLGNETDIIVSPLDHCIFIGFGHLVCVHSLFEQDATKRYCRNYAEFKNFLLN